MRRRVKAFDSRDRLFSIFVPLVPFCKKCSRQGVAHQEQIWCLVVAEGEHTRPRVWFTTPRREHWGKTFDAGARRIAREARALPFELKPKPALYRPTCSNNPTSRQPM
jgi:hypothetical protein